jgi:hypothetical protein
VARQRRHVCIRLFLTVFGAFGVLAVDFTAYHGSLQWVGVANVSSKAVLASRGKTTSHGSPLSVTVVK